METNMEIAQEKIPMIAVKLLGETVAKIKELHKQANEKDYGRQVTLSDLASRALALITKKEIEELMEKSITNEERIEMAFADYQKENPTATKDEFFGLLLTGKAKRPKP